MWFTTMQDYINAKKCVKKLWKNMWDWTYLVEKGRWLLIQEWEYYLSAWRFTNLKINQRVCRLCAVDKVEDEFHFIFHCAIYEPTRREFFNRVANNIEGFWSMSDLDKLKLFNTEYVRQLCKISCHNYPRENESWIQG